MTSFSGKYKVNDYPAVKSWRRKDKDEMVKQCFVILSSSYISNPTP